MKWAQAERMKGMTTSFRFCVFGLKGFEAHIFNVSFPPFQFSVQFEMDVIFQCCGDSFQCLNKRQGTNETLRQEISDILAIGSQQLQGTKSELCCSFHHNIENFHFNHW